MTESRLNKTSEREYIKMKKSVLKKYYETFGLPLPEVSNSIPSSGILETIPPLGGAVSPTQF